MTDLQGDFELLNFTENELNIEPHFASCVGLIWTRYKYSVPFQIHQFCPLLEEVR